MVGKLTLSDTRPRVFSVLETLVQICVVCVFGLFLSEYLFFNCSTESRSMEPTIQPDSVVFIDRIDYIFNEPDRFDVAAFYRSSSSSPDILIRRVIGLPGELIELSRGKVYIDGEELDVSPYASEITSDGIAEGGIRLGQHEYFVLGDTPANSEDSRSTSIGPVHESSFIGRAWLTSGSITEFRIIH